MHIHVRTTNTHRLQSMDELLAKTVPTSIRLQKEPNMGTPLSMIFCRGRGASCNGTRSPTAHTC